MSKWVSPVKDQGFILKVMASTGSDRHQEKKKKGRMQFGMMQVNQSMLKLLKNAEKSPETISTARCTLNCLVWRQRLQITVQEGNIHTHAEWRCTKTCCIFTEQYSYLDNHKRVMLAHKIRTETPFRRTDTAHQISIHNFSTTNHKHWCRNNYLIMLLLLKERNWTCPSFNIIVHKCV